MPRRRSRGLSDVELLLVILLVIVFFVLIVTIAFRGL